MIFQQEVYFGVDNQDFVNICKEHPECKECPFLTQDINLKGGLTRCDTGRGKKNAQ